MANFNFNKVIIGGRLTADPELKTTPSGISVCSFVVAVNRNYKGPDGRKDKTQENPSDGFSVGAQAKSTEADHDMRTRADFLNVTAWRGTAEFITRFFRKASSICVVGSVQTRSWVTQAGEKRYATEIVADEAYFVDKLSESPAGVNQAAGDQGSAQGPATAQGQAPAPGAFMTPGARGQFEEIEDDGELPF